MKSSFCFLICLVTSLMHISINARRTDYELKDWQIGSEFFVSDAAPITKVLNSIPGAAENAQLLLDHVRSVENAVYFARQFERSNSTGVDPDLLKTCNNYDPKFINQVYVRFGAWGWPVADTSCVTDVGIRKDTEAFENVTEYGVSNHTTGDIYNALFEFSNSLKDNAKRLSDATNLNFSDPDAGANYELNLPSGERCLLQHTAAVRFGETWYLQAEFTNRQATTFQMRRNRLDVQEFPTVINGTFASPKKMCMRINNDTDIWKNGTTQIGHWRGVVDPFIFGRTPIDKNPSIKSAMAKADDFLQRAYDALSPSNIAILVLPLFLNLVPIALISSVTTSFMLFYTILTDVLTVIPLGIKGAELISIGSSTHRSVTVRISSSITLPRSEAAAAELWAAECYAPANVQSLGVAFLVLSIIFMIFGIVAELVAQRYMRRKNEAMMRELEEAEPLIFPNSGTYGGAHNAGYLWYLPMPPPPLFLPEVQPTAGVPQWDSPTENQAVEQAAVMIDMQAREEPEGVQSRNTINDDG